MPGGIGKASLTLSALPPAMGVQPPNFSWVLPGRLAGLALPRLPAHYQFLLDLGVRHLVSLTERGPPHSDSCPGLTLHRLRIPDFCPPAPEQIDQFVKIVDDANARGEVSEWEPKREGGAWEETSGRGRAGGWSRKGAGEAVGRGDVGRGGAKWDRAGLELDGPTQLTRVNRAARREGR